jgi:hypothetical protein
LNLICSREEIPTDRDQECKCKNYAAQECYKDWVSQGVACPSPTPSVSPLHLHPYLYNIKPNSHLQPCEAVLARTETPTATPTSTTGPIYCGGFAGLGCPEGYACIDDISDDCDPNNGGADCIGICSWPETP